jgi:hypothetical protein
VVAYRSSSNYTKELNLQPILIKNSPQAHMELEFDVLGVGGKLMKYVVHSSKRKIGKRKSYLRQCQSNKQGVLGLKDFDGLMHPNIVGSD